MPKGVYLHKPENLIVQIEAMAQANRGKYRAPSTKRKISENNKRLGLIPPSAKGRKWPASSRARWSEAQRGSNGHFYSRHHSVETRRVLSELNRRESNPHWQGGITALTESLRHTVEFRLWREVVFARDDYTCQDCGRRGGRLHSHHIKSFAEYPELRLDVNNGVTLCQDCHAKTENFGGKAIVGSCA